MAPYRIAVVGVGKIAQDQHLPVIAEDPDFILAALVSQRGLEHPAAPTFGTLTEALGAVPDLDAVAVCTPPGVRYALAREALDAGKHVLLEKPPTQTVSELVELAARAGRLGRVLFTTWHSQYNAAVEDARARLANRRVRTLAITWREDVRRWHPGQEWIWNVGGFGVFDPGINALSILTRITPGPIFVRDAELVYPANRSMPIAARLTFASPVAAPGADLTADFDWRQTGEQSWNIDIETDDGQTMRLTEGGSKLFVDGVSILEKPLREYQGIYRRFAELLSSGTSQVDMAPFQLVADSFLLGKRVETDPFTE